MNAMTAAEALCHALVAEGVEVIFGHPGGAILPFYDALHRVGAPRHVLMRHEQAAAHAADGYARATGRVGVCVATSGPGATNLVTGLATAQMDSVPLVAITGQVPSALRGQDAFQETDILGITIPVTKHGFIVERPEDLPAIVREAFRIARSGRPGPVLIDIPKDVQNGPCPFEPASAATNGAGARIAPWLPGHQASRGASGANGGRQGVGDTLRDAAALDAAAKLLNEAERPVIMAGRGVVVAGMAEVLRALAERADLPVVTTLLGLDAFPATHPLALGMPGMHGTVRACRAIQRADVILGLGLRFDDRVTGPAARFAPGAKIIHMDIDAAVIGRTVKPALRIVGDLRETLPALLERIAPADHAAWWAELREWPREAAPAASPGSAGPTAAGPLTAREAARALAARIAASGGIVATDVGQHQMLIAQELRDAAPGSHLTSGGLGTMGYALPAALGAALGRPDKPVWAVAGDGGFQMTLQELATVVQERVPIRIAVLNNGYLGMVRQWQELFYERRYSASEITGPDFTMLARAYGVPARRVRRLDELDEALDWAERVHGPALLDLRLPAEENVFPMVPPGASLDEIIVAPDAEVAA
ncbi:MAG TPA: biosynthetic-type acetolactate synthase large subunit [Longimicrobiales bacterium]